MRSSKQYRFTLFQVFGDDCVDKAGLYQRLKSYVVNSNWDKHSRLHHFRCTTVAVVSSDMFVRQIDRRINGWTDRQTFRLLSGCQNAKHLLIKRRMSRTVLQFSLTGNLGVIICLDCHYGSVNVTFIDRQSTKPVLICWFYSSAVISCFLTSIFSRCLLQLIFVVFRQHASVLLRERILLITINLYIYCHWY